MLLFLLFLYKYYCCHCTGYDRDHYYDWNNRKSATARLYITVCIHIHIRVIYCLSDFQLKILRSFRYISRFIFIRKSHSNLRISIRHFFAFQHGINRTGCTSFHISDENLLFFDSISFKSGFCIIQFNSSQIIKTAHNICLATDLNGLRADFKFAEFEPCILFYRNRDR